MKNSIILLVFTLLIISCNKTTETPIEIPLGCDTIHLERNSQNLYQFGKLILEDLVPQGENNTVISPLSLEMALGMAMNGADEETAKEMMSILSPQRQSLDCFNDNLNHIQCNSRISEQFHIANSCFYDPLRVPMIETEFLEKIKKDYQAGIFQSDFNTQGVTDINQWVDQETKGKIKKLLEEIKTCEFMFLLNALTLECSWENGFDPDYTRPIKFKDEEENEVDFMTSEADRQYYLGEDMQFVELFLEDSLFAMDFIMPLNTSPLSWISDQDNLRESLLTLRAQSISSEVSLAIPKFEIKGKYRLKENLDSLNDGKSFGANLSRIAPSANCGGPPFIERVIHDIYLKIDEKGVDGAAVTAVSIGTESVPQPLVFDSPFFFVIYLRESDVPIFIGVVDEL